jgi:UPF0755 protein
MIQSVKNSGGLLLKKQNNNLLIRAISFFTVLFIGFICLVYWWNNGLKPNNINDNSATEFMVSEGEGIKSITSRLFQNKLISSQTVFFLMLKIYGIDRKIQAGNYRLQGNMDALTLARTLTHGVSDKWITIIEGLRKEEAAFVLAKELNIPESEFLSLASEGYIFPDTYAFPDEATAGAVLALIDANFRKKTDPLFASYKGEFLKDELLILASLIEREGKSENDKPIIAGVLINRLKKNWPLQVDATLQYAIGYQSQEKTWWKKNLTNLDKKIVSPFNTYENVGLPPAPIANPGLMSIRSAMNPIETDYMYYLHDENGQVHFARNILEHEQNINKYLIK